MPPEHHPRGVLPRVGVIGRTQRRHRRPQTLAHADQPHPGTREDRRIDRQPGHNPLQSDLRPYRGKPEGRLLLTRLTALPRQSPTVYCVMAITAPGCNQRMIFTRVASSRATQPAVGEPLVVCTKNAPPPPGMRSLLTPMTMA